MTYERLTEQENIKRKLLKEVIEPLQKASEEAEGRYFYTVLLGIPAALAAIRLMTDLDWFYSILATVIAVFIWFVIISIIIDVNEAVKIVPEGADWFRKMFPKNNASYDVAIEVLRTHRSETMVILSLKRKLGIKLTEEEEKRVFSRLRIYRRRRK